MSRTINQAGIDLIKHFEGLRLTAYPDPGTKGEPYTIGYGHTGKVKPTDKITEDQAEQLLKQDLARFVDGVNNLVTYKISDNAFAALVVFAYNVGLSNFKSSTLLLRVNLGKASDAASEFGKWNKAAGNILPGLVKRRKAEADLFIS